MSVWGVGVGVGASRGEGVGVMAQSDRERQATTLVPIRHQFFPTLLPQEVVHNCPNCPENSRSVVLHAQLASSARSHCRRPVTAAHTVADR